MGETLTMRQVGDLVRSGRLRFEPYATERDGVPVTGTAVVLLDSGRERDAEWREPCCPRCRALSDSELLMVKSLREVKRIGPYTMLADGVVVCAASGEVVPFAPPPGAAGVSGVGGVLPTPRVTWSALSCAGL
jgi:hypothetical protein